MAEWERKLDQHMKHRLSIKTITKEIYNHLCHKVLPQGCDEVANTLFSGSAYLPWPGNGGPRPVEPPTIIGEPREADMHAALYGIHLDQAARDAVSRENADKGFTR